MYINPIKLRINNIPSDKYSICTGAPVFSWGVDTDDSSILQKAYQIKVYSDNNLLWDSGIVESGDTSAAYQGQQLLTGMRIRWELSLTGSNGKKSNPMCGEFKVVPENLDDVMSITKKDNERFKAMYFLKQFRCDKDIKQATLYVSGIGYQSVTINGEKADDAFMQPTVSNFAKRVYFVTLEVENFIKKGDNSLGIKVGKGWRDNYGEYLVHASFPYPELFGTLQLAARLVIEYTDGTLNVIETDESWKAFNGGTVSNDLFLGETFDANEEPKDWNIPGYDCSGHENAVKCESAGTLVPQNVEPIKINNILKPIKKYMISPGKYLLDFGINVAGIPRIRVPQGMKKGDKITMIFSEEIGLDGDIVMDTMRGADSKDIYISDGEDAGNIWAPEFLYHGFRYATVEGWTGVLEKDDIEALVIYSQVDTESHFRCGSALVNQIYENLVRTEQDNLHGIATDCPQRDERMGWLNDATVRFEEIAYNFNVARLFPKIVSDIVDEQHSDGSISCCAPRIYGYRPADPVCSSFLIAGMQTWLHYGNMDVIKDNYENFKAWNECLKNNSDDGIVNYSYYGDWAGPADCCPSYNEAISAITPGILMSTGYHYFNYKLLAEMAKLIGNEDEMKINLSEAERVRKAYLDKWWDKETGVIATGSQACQAFTLWLGMLEGEDAVKAAEVLHKNVVEVGYRTTAGNLCSRYLMDILADYGYIDDAWKIITREEYPSFGFMIQNGATTIWERFEQKENNGMNSHNHPMYGAVGSWFYSHIAGLVPLENGWKKFRVQPYIPTDLVHTEACLDTIRGEVSINWFKRYGKLNIHINVPYGCEAEYIYDGETKYLGHGFHCFNYEVEEYNREDY